MQRFYGGSLMDWMREIPFGVIRACMRMLPRLRAEESQRESERVYIGTHRNVDQADFKDITQGWRREAYPNAAASSRATPWSHNLSIMGDMGIGVVKVPKSA